MRNGQGFVYTDTGIRITEAYDETYTWVIHKRGSGTTTQTIIPTIVDYNLTANDTLITNIDSPTEGQLISIAIVPNGFTYTFDTGFLFGDAPPRQMPNGLNTLQIFDFKYVSAANGFVCYSQTINVPHA